MPKPKVRIYLRRREQYESRAGYIEAHAVQGTMTGPNLIPKRSLTSMESAGQAAMEEAIRRYGHSFDFEIVNPEAGQAEAGQAEEKPAEVA